MQQYYSRGQKALNNARGYFPKHVARGSSSSEQLLACRKMQQHWETESTNDGRCACLVLSFFSQFNVASPPFTSLQSLSLYSTVHNSSQPDSLTVFLTVHAKRLLYLSLSLSLSYKLKQNSISSIYSLITPSSSSFSLTHFALDTIWRNGCCWSGEARRSCLCVCV